MNGLVRSIINHSSQQTLILLSYAQENTSSQHLTSDVTKDIARQFLQCAHVNPGGTCLHGYCDAWNGTLILALTETFFSGT